MTVLENIRRHWFLRHSRHGLFPKLEWTQRGGAIIYVKTHPIHIREVKDGETLYIHGGPKRPCFELQLIRNEKHSILQGVQGRQDCFTDLHTDSRDILRAAIKVAKDHGILTMEFTDNSTIRCPERLTLSDLSFLTTGQTWYESVIPNLSVTDMPIIEVFRKRVLTNTWRSVGNGLLQFDTTGIDIDLPGSAMAVLARAKKSRTNCGALSANMDMLLLQSGILSLYGRHWACRL
jgi:hypothetical protein